MNEGYSDEETLELQEEEQPNQSWSATSASSDRIRRSCASTDISALMDTEMDADSGQEEDMTGQQHEEALPHRLIEFYKEKFTANCNSRWNPPVSLDDRFRDMLDRAVEMCEAGRADGTVDMFVSDNLLPLFRKYYYTHEAIDHWTPEIFHDIGEVVFRVIRMVRGLIVAGVGSRDINTVLWDLFYHAATETKTNLMVGDRLYALRLDVDESAAADLIKPDCNTNTHPMQKYMRMAVLTYDEQGFDATERFFTANITASTPIEELIRYLKSFRTMVVVMKSAKAYATFGPIVYTAIDRLMGPSEEEASCKNLRGPIDSHPLFGLYMHINVMVHHIAQLQDSGTTMLSLFQWRLRFLLRVINEAPFNGRMGAVENLTCMLNDHVPAVLAGGRQQHVVLMRWLEEERAVDILTRDNLHNASYVDRVQRTFEAMLKASIFTCGDLSTVWEAQRGKHDVIQRNLAELIIRIVAHFDNDLLEALFHKIEAGWVDGGTRERDMLIDIVKRIGENSAFNINGRRESETDHALVQNALQVLWTFIRQPGSNRDNEEAVLHAHLKLLEEARRLQEYVKTYAELCAADIEEAGELAATAASHLVHILELVSDEEEDEDELGYDESNPGTYELIGYLESEHSLVRSLCINIAKTVKSCADRDARKRSLAAFLNALVHLMHRNKQHLALSEKQASDLWQTLISSPVVDNDMRQGYKFFSEVVRGELMAGPMLELFFKDYVLNVPASSVTLEGYNCFEAFFKAVNEAEGKSADFFKRPENLLGAAYVKELILHGKGRVFDRASGLWTEYLQKMIEKERQPVMTTSLVQTLVSLIMEQYAALAECVKEERLRALHPMQTPIYESTKNKTARCIQVLNMLVLSMDEDLSVAKRSVVSLGKAAIGRPISVYCKVPRREWDSLNYKYRNNMRAEELDQVLDVHENTTVAELRILIKDGLEEKLKRKRSDAVDEILDHFLLVFISPDGAKNLLFADYKRTLGDMGMADVADVEIRLHKTTSPRQGEGSDDTDTSEGDWMSPEEMEDDHEKESILPSKALAADEAMIDRLLEVAECEDVDIAMAAFKILTMVPQNGQKLRDLHLKMRNEAALRALLEQASDPRFLYYLMMLEAIILPTETPLSDARDDSSAYDVGTTAMMMFIRVLPHVGELSKLMKRSLSYRSLALVPITHILLLACQTATRVVINTRFRLNPTMNSAIGSLLRLSDAEQPPKWTKHLRVRRMSSAYAEHLSSEEGKELLALLETHSSLQLHILCGVLLSGSAYQTLSPLADDLATVLAALVKSPLTVIDETTLESTLGPCTIPALLECAVYAMAMLVAACPLQCAEFLGAVTREPDPAFFHALIATTFHKAENVRGVAWSLTAGMVHIVRASLEAMHIMDRDQAHVSLTQALLDLLPSCKGKDRYADHFVNLVKECLMRSNLWERELKRLEEHITQGVEFLETALLQSNADQTPFPDETYLRARIEVLRILIRYTSESSREHLGCAADGPRLCERLLADFIFPAARAADAAAAAVGDGSATEPDVLPRSVTHMEMNSSSSLFELTAAAGEAALPRSLSALPIASGRRVAVCSGESSQEGAFNLLLALCDGVPENQILMQHTIHRLFYTNPWTDKKDFDYLPHHILRAEGDLVGLKNGGATCYMNSIFQQLFMIDEVREAVLNATIPEKVLLEHRTSDSSSISGRDAEGGASPNRAEYAVKVLAAVQSLFAHLLGSELESYRPAEFWKVFNFKPNGESVNVREQQDAVEFHNMVTELIDEGLKKCGSEAMCEKTFRGVFADEKICKDCPHRYTKEEPFESLSLDVRSHNNLRDSLKEYVKGDVLENDNAYHCEQCNAKVKAIKRMSLSKLPEVLIVQLKRFDFDWEKEIAVKFNDYFEFPFEVDFQPYTVEGLEKLEKGLPLENNRDYQYMLRGVVVHSGQAQGGHYTSYIRNRETGKWFKFDDQDVTLWDASESGAQQRWFGCSDNGLDSMGRGRKRVRTTYWNAYMLFYEKLETAIRYISVNPSSVTSSDMSTSSGVSSMTTTMTTIMTSAVSSTAISCASPTAAGTMTMTSSVTPVTTMATSPSAVVGATAIVTPGAAISPTMRGAEPPAKSRPGKSVSPVSNLHRHFSSMSLSSARIRMPPRLEEMLREGNRRVQLERVQYSTHFFAFITSATCKALVSSDMARPELQDRLTLETMKSFSSFIVHNGLFASKDLMNDDGLQKCTFRTWFKYMEKLLESKPARLWFITHVLFSHEIAACFLFASDMHVREFFRSLIYSTMRNVEDAGDTSDACLDKEVTSPIASTLANSLRLFPRLSHLLANLLGMLPYKHNSAFRSEPVDFYRTIVEMAERPNMLAAIVRGGILNNLLALFSPIHIHTDLSSLSRRDSVIYEGIHRVVANGLRTIRFEKNEAEAEPKFCDKNLIIRTRELPELKVLNDFLAKDGGHVKFAQHLVELLRRASRANGAELHWAMWGLLWLCDRVASASAVVMDMVCQCMGSLLSETASEWLVTLLREIFSIDDEFTEHRFEHLFFKAQLTSTHAHPSVQGLVEYQSVAETRTEALIRVLLGALECFPRALIAQIDRSEPVLRCISNMNTYAICKPKSKYCQALHNWYEDHIVTASASTSEEKTRTETESVAESTTGDSAMDDEPSARSEKDAGKPPPYHAGGTQVDQLINNATYSAGQLSPSSRLGAMTLTPGDKRPLPPAEDGEESDGCKSDRKRSIGETMVNKGTRVQWSNAATAAAAAATTSTTATSMDDSVTSMDADAVDNLLLFSSSAVMTPSVPPPAYSPPPPAYSNAAAARTAAAAVPPPVPPRPAARHIAAVVKPVADPDEFVERHKRE